MGAGTSGLQRDLDDLDGAFEAHRTDYGRFPSSDGLALRDKVDAHLKRYATATATNGAQGTDSAFQDHRTDYGRFPSSHGLALRERLNTHLQSWNTAAIASDKRVDTLQINASDLADRVGTVEAGYGTLNSATATLKKDLLMLQGQYGGLASGQCDVKFQCPLDSSYASSLDVAALQTSVGGKATQSDVNALKTRLVSLEAAPGNESKADQSELNALSAQMGTTSSDLATLRTSVGGKATQSDVNALKTRLVSLETAPGNESNGVGTSLVDSKAEQRELDALSARVDALEEAPPGVAIVPVDVKSINDSVVGAAIAWSACYPDGGQLRDYIELDCNSRGAGWSHKGSTGQGAALFTCFRHKDDSGVQTYRMGVCHQAPG